MNSAASLPKPSTRWRVKPWRVLLYAALTVSALLWVYPFVWMLATAFKPSAEAAADPLRLIPLQPTLENFARAWSQANFSRYLLNSTLVTLGSVTLTLFLTATAGFALGRRSFPGRAFILGVLGATLFLPSGYTIIPIFDLINRIGLNNTLLGIIVASAGTGFVIHVFLFTAYFAGLPRELEEAALVDGASIHQIFWRVMLPLAGPVVATVAIFEFMQTWNAFLIPLVLTLTRPDLRVLGVGMYSFFGENSVDTTGLMAAACISLIPIILVFLFLQRYFVEGVAGAVKS